MLRKTPKKLQEDSLLWHM